MIAKTFTEILKFNPYHDRLGRFTGPGGYASFSANPDTTYGRAAIKREQKKNPLIGAAYGTKRSKGQIQDEKQRKAVSGKVRSMMSDYGIKDGKDQMTDDIHSLYKEAKQDGKIYIKDGGIRIKRSAYEKANEIARKAIDRAEITDNSTAAEYKALRDYVRNTPVKISDYDRQNIADYGSYRKQNFGGVKVSRNGISMDSFYEELSGKFPHLFDSGRTSNQADQLIEINDVLRSLKPTGRKYSGQMKEEAVKQLTNDIINGFVQVAS